MTAPQIRLRTQRHLKTRWSVRGAEVLSRWVITVGGLATIVTVLLVCVFLVSKVFPLFLPASLSQETETKLNAPPGKLLRLQLDDYQKLGCGLFDGGEAALMRLDDGKVLDKRRAFQDAKVTAVSSADRGDKIAVGFADGTIRTGSFGFGSKLLKDAEVQQALHKLGRDELKIGEQVEYGKGLLERIQEDKYRLQTLTAEFIAPADEAPPSKAPVVGIDYTEGSSGKVVCALTGDGTVTFYTIDRNPVDEEMLQPVEGEPLHLPKRDDNKPPDHLLITGLGDNVFAVWDDGHLVRISSSDPASPRIAETVELFDRPGIKLTALAFVVGKTTLLVGDSEGGVSAWFTVRSDQARGTDGWNLTRIHTMPRGSAAVTALHPSSRSRMFAAGYADGTVRVYQATAANALVQARCAGGQPVRFAELSPRDDGLVALNDSGLFRWQFQPEHPEVTLHTLFFPVWYEGFPKPEHVWQATSDSDAYEPKFGMTALIFGTLKATFYSMLIGVPLALLAAIYTSEFMHPRIRTVVKPAIEMMASLPSVVLGFLAAAVFAPFVEHYLASALAFLLTLPLSFVIGGHLWQLLPESRRVVLSRWRMPFVALCLPIAIVSALFVGPLLEAVLFRGNFRGWLDGHWGSALSGWFLLLLPFAAVLAIYAIGSFVNPWLDWRTRLLKRRWTAWVSVAKLAAGCVAAVLLALCLGELLTVCGLDPRGSLVGTYEQRNSVIVGFAMGFAIIPIIFTIADDALTAVPAHLRSASLGCGATPWQTALRVVVPTAASGLFSAIMIGLGRAVGETMIVLMAAGNTPLIDLNPFNGFETLSAALAVEMKEAARGSTHERTLYLGALILFAITFVLNTVAEAVRQRFRKRAVQL